MDVVKPWLYFIADEAEGQWSTLTHVQLMKFSSHICISQVDDVLQPYLCLAAIFVFCRLMQHVDEVPPYTCIMWCLAAIFVYYRLMQHVDEVPGHKRNVQRARYRDGSRQIRQDGALHRPLPRRYRNNLRHRCEYRLTHSRLVQTERKRRRKSNCVSIWIWII